MKTLQEKMAQLEIDHAEEIKRENLKDNILKQLPVITSETGKGYSFFMHELYGCKINITAGNSFRGDTVPLETVYDFLKKFPPLDLKKYRDGFCSFRLRSYLDKNEERAKIENIKPLLIKMANPTYGSASAKLSFYILLDGNIINMRFYIPSNQIGYISYKRNEYRGGFTIKDVNLVNQFGGNSIVWGTGSAEAVNESTIYNIDIDTIKHKLEKLES